MLVVVGELGVLCDALLSGSSSRTNKRWSSSTFDDPSTPRLADDCARLAFAGSDKPLRFEDVYPDRLLGVGTPVRTRERIGRQEGRQARAAVRTQVNYGSPKSPYRKRWLCCFLFPSKHLLEQSSSPDQENADPHLPKRRDER